MLWFIGFYIAGMVLTAIFNLYIVIGPVRPGALFRNALAWPAFLPILAFLYYQSGRR